MNFHTGTLEFTGSPTEVRANTGAGGIDGRLTAVTGGVQCHTGIGGIVLVVESPSDFNLAARSGMGTVTPAVGDRVVRPPGAGRSLQRSVGRGGPRLDLATGMGSVEVRAPGSTPAGSEPASRGQSTTL